MKILVTGSSGLIGPNIIKLLNDRHQFSGLDKDRGSLDINTTLADAANINEILPAFRDTDAVVHLAANSSVSTPWEDVLNNNILLTRNVFEAAKYTGVKKVVFASSNHAVGNFEFDEPYCKIIKGNYDGVRPGTYQLIDHKVPIRPDSNYGVSKAFGEAMGRYYSEHFGLEITCLRIGTVNAQNKPTNTRAFSTWLSYQDLAQLIELSLVRSRGFKIFYGVSDNTWKIWDIEYAREVIGYNPISNAEDYR